MRLLEIWVATPLARALGWALIHSLWEGAAISAALACVLALTRSARVRYIEACCAMLAIVVAIAITFLRLMPDGIGGLRNPVPLGTLPWNAAPLRVTAHASSGLAAAVPWLAPLWMLGVSIFLLAQIAGWISVSRLRVRGVCCAADHWQNELARLRACLRLSRPVQLLESCLADVPMVVGHVRPVILMPIGLLAGLPTNQIEAILLHELAHIRRSDYVVNILERAVESLFFYHPAVWWISSVIRSERENCCDDIAVATSGNAEEYAAALTAIEEHRWPGRQAALAATGGNLMKRIHRLLYPKAPSAVWAPLVVAIFLVTTALATFAAWPSQDVAHQNWLNQDVFYVIENKLLAWPADPLRRAPVRAQDQKAAESPYQKWLNEDVVYIITPQERATFEKLTTDAERDKFIEEFWERRNPNPGSAINAYKERHYYAIAHANQLFGTNGKAGWRTDRGHMLILYGPPDEIDSHEDAKPYAYEEWMYRHIKGVGDNVTLTFIDRSGEGDYQLAPGPVNKGAAGSRSAKPDQRDSGAGLRPVSQSQVPEAGTNGYSYPKCIDCPQVQYTQDAYVFKFQGKIALNMIITADGRAEDIKAVKPLPYGLTEKAIKTVKKWRFKPATDPDGKPAAVRQKIEISFHLY